MEYYTINFDYEFCYPEKDVNFIVEYVMCIYGKDKAVCGLKSWGKELDYDIYIDEVLFYNENSEYYINVDELKQLYLKEYIDIVDYMLSYEVEF